jgi:hypothetical protein
MLLRSTISSCAGTVLDASHSRRLVIAGRRVRVFNGLEIGDLS